MAGPRAPVGTLGAHVASAAALSREQRQNSRISSSAPAAFKNTKDFGSSSSSSSDDSSSDSDSDSDIENGETSLQFQSRLSQSAATKINGAQKKAAGATVTPAKPASSGKGRTKVEEVAESPVESPPKSKSSKKKATEEIDETPVKAQSRKDVIHETPTKSLPSKSPSVNGLKARYESESSSEDESSEDEAPAKKPVAKIVSKDDSSSSEEESESDSESEDEKAGAKITTKTVESESDSESSEDDSKSDASEDLGLDAGKKATTKHTAPVTSKKVARPESSSSESESSSGESDSDSEEQRRPTSKVKALIKPSKPAMKSADSSSDSESGSDESESESEGEKRPIKPQSQVVSNKVAKSVEDSSSSSDESDNETSSSGSDEDSDVEMADESFAFTTRTDGEQAVTTAGQVPELIAPGFHLRKAADQGNASDVAEIFRDAQLNGKQIWYFTAPASAPITAIEDMEIPLDTEDEKPVMSHNGIDYSMAFDDGSAQKSVTLVIPNASGDKYTAVNRPVDRVIHFQRTTTFIPGNGVASSSRAIVPATKPPRPQPEGLRVRFSALGVPSSSTTKSILKVPQNRNEDAETRSSAAIPQSETKKKRKHADEEDDVASQETVKTSKSEKKAKKLRLEEDAASARTISRKSTTPIPPPVINGVSATPKPLKQTPVLPPTSTFAPKPSNEAHRAPASSPPPTTLVKTPVSKTVSSSQPVKASRQTPIPLPTFPASTQPAAAQRASGSPLAKAEKAKKRKEKTSTPSQGDESQEPKKEKRKRRKIKTEETD